MTTVTGTTGNDRLIGSGQNDILIANGGADVLLGLGGGDVYELLFRRTPGVDAPVYEINESLGGDSAIDTITGVGSLTQTYYGQTSLSYDFPWLLGQKGATARHAIYGGQWRRLGRKQLGLPGPLRSMINRRLHHRA